MIDGYGHVVTVIEIKDEKNLSKHLVLVWDYFLKMIVYHNSIEK